MNAVDRVVRPLVALFTWLGDRVPPGLVWALFGLEVGAAVWLLASWAQR